MLTCKTPRRSLRQLDETRQKIKKFYNYCSQSVAHQFSFKDFLKKFGAIAMVSFPCRLSGYTFHRDVGGDRDTNTTFYLPFGSKVKFSSRVHLLNWIAKKALRMENRIMLTSGSFEKRSPKRVGLIIQYLSMVSSLALTWLFLEAQYFPTCLFHVKWGNWICIISGSTEK